MSVAKTTFIPHHTNNHWPLALRHRTLVYVSSVLIAIKLLAIVAFALTPNIAKLSTITDGRMLQLTNQARTEVGLTPLTHNNALFQAAKQKGEDMLKHQYFAHISPSGVTPWFWMKQTGYTYQVAGENLAIDFLDSEDVVAAWLASPTHKANLLHKDYTETGIAVVSGEFQGGTSIIVVHMFGKPLGEATQASPAPEEDTLAPPPVATPVPEPVVTPVPLPAAPRTPRITLVHSPSDEHDEAVFAVEGDKLHSVILLIGNQERFITTLPETGSLNISIASNQLPPGTLIAKAFTRNTNGVESEVSAAISFTNPKPSPAPAREYTFALAPAFDQQQVALVGGSSSNVWQLLSLRAPITIDNQTVQIAPTFTLQENEAARSFAATIANVSRNTTLLVIIAITLLLLLAVVIRINIQHPALIMHTSIVIFLAGILLFT